MGKSPVKEEPKYKLEILKMELVSPSADAVLPENKLNAKKVLMVIAPKDFQDQEYAKPKALLEAKGIKVTVASASKQTATGMSGLKVKPDVLIKDVRAADYDAVVFIGGNGVSRYFTDPQALALAIEASKNQKIIGAICLAPVILAKAGILEGKKATVSPFGKDELKKAKVHITGNIVEIDGKIVTGRGPDAAADFGQALLKQLQKD